MGGGLLYKLTYEDGSNVLDKDQNLLHYNYDNGKLRIRAPNVGDEPMERDVSHVKINGKYMFLMPVGEYSFTIIRKANNNFVVGKKFMTAYDDIKIPSENKKPLPSDRVSEAYVDDDEDGDGMPYPPGAGVHADGSITKRPKSYAFGRKNK